MFCVGALATSGAQTPTAGGVTVAGSQLADEGRSLTVTFRNTTGHAVTAWGIEAIFRLGDGQERVEGRTRDGFAEAEGIDTRENSNCTAVPAYGEATATLRFPREAWRSQVVDVEVKLLWVIFENGTAMGEESGIAEMFAVRADMARAYAQIKDALLRAAGAGAGLAALTRAGEELDFPTERGASYVLTHGTRLNISRALDRARAGQASGAELDRVFRDVLTDATRRAEAAARHAVRR
jgi:hypothetical protein